MDKPNDDIAVDLREGLGIDDGAVNLEPVLDIFGGGVPQTKGEILEKLQDAYNTLYDKQEYEAAVEIRDIFVAAGEQVAPRGGSLGG